MRASRHLRALAPSLLVLAAVVGGAGSPAHADAIGIVERDCPEGTIFTANHGGQWCVAGRPCTDDQDCDALEVCSPDPIALCVVNQSYVQGARLATDRATTRVVRVGLGPCDASCASPASCETTRRCVRAPAPPAPPSPPPPSSAPSSASGGCAAHPSAPHDTIAALAVMCLLGLATRRR
ncbi:MAG: hypothetical protein K1X94_20715 [Sandaracinaceae bacterium]|nr:hypothetical protein [Sandaracinaceae bacterium]